jgi:Mn2+/Fe2+ NRAMP family transporter
VAFRPAGAQFAYGMTWVMLFCYPLMAAIQEVSAWIGRSADRGSPATSGNITRSGWCEVIVFLLVVANIINLGAMGEATRLLLGGPAHLCVVRTYRGRAIADIKR